MNEMKSKEYVSTVLRSYVIFLVKLFPSFLDDIVQVGDIVMDDFERRLEERIVKFVLQQLIHFLFRL